MNKKGQFGILLGVVIVVFIIIVGYFIFNDGINKEESDALTSRYISEIYPEFSNCSIRYSTGMNDCASCPYYNGAVVSCSNNSLGNRDSLDLVSHQADKTFKIEFKNITLKQIKNYYEVGEKLK